MYSATVKNNTKKYWNFLTVFDNSLDCVKCTEVVVTKSLKMHYYISVPELTCDYSLTAGLTLIGSFAVCSRRLYPEAVVAQFTAA